MSAKHTTIRSQSTTVIEDGVTHHVHEVFCSCGHVAKVVDPKSFADKVRQAKAQHDAETR